MSVWHVEEKTHFIGRNSIFLSFSVVMVTEKAHLPIQKG